MSAYQPLLADDGRRASASGSGVLFDPSHEYSDTAGEHDATLLSPPRSKARGKRKTSTNSDSGLASDSDDEHHMPSFAPVPISHGPLQRMAPPARSHEIYMATKAQKKAIWWRGVFITGMFILSWYTFATILSLYNKWMFSEEYYGFIYPLFVSGCHMVVQFILAAIIRVVWAEQFRPPERPSRKDYVTRITPTALATGADIGLSNLSLKTITLSLYTMCKSSALIFVLMFAFLFRLEKYSHRLVSVIGMISVGVFMMVFDVTSVSIPGIIMVFSASAIGGLRWALTQLIMQKRSIGMSNPFATIYWLAPMMGATLLLVSLAIENWYEIFTSKFFDGALATLKSIGIIALPGAIAFAMVSSEYFVIQYSGVVPLSVAGIFKEVSTIMVSSLVFGDKLSPLNVVGVVVTIAGIALYSFHKYQKTINSDLEVDAEGNPIARDVDEDDERAPLRGHYRSPSGHHHPHDIECACDESASAHFAHTTDLERQGDISLVVAPGSPSSSEPEIPLRNLDSRTASRRSRASTESDPDDRATRLRDEFEGWDNVHADSHSDEEEMDLDEVARIREQSQSRWGKWWDKSM